MVSTEILDVMTKDHLKIFGMIEELKRDVSVGHKSVSEHFDGFVWYLKKHMFVEERAIFESFNNVITDGYLVVPRLMDDHNEILDILRGLNKELVEGKQIDLGYFEEVLTRHKDFEEESVYPRLDQELSGDDRDRLLTQIKEII